MGLTLPIRHSLVSLPTHFVTLFSFTPRPVSYRTLTTWTPNSWNLHETLALSTEYSVIVIVFFVKWDLYSKSNADSFALRTLISVLYRIIVFPLELTESVSSSIWIC